MVKALDGGFVCWETILGPDLAKAFSERGGECTQGYYIWGRKGGRETAIRFGCREKEGKGFPRKKTSFVEQLPVH